MVIAINPKTPLAQRQPFQPLAPARRRKRTTDADLHVATRLKAARLEAGLSQEKAAETINVAFQQLQKYETGRNRISVGKLAALATIYNKPIGWFFEGLTRNGSTLTDDLGSRLISEIGGAALARAYLSIEKGPKRIALLEIAKALV